MATVSKQDFVYSQIRARLVEGTYPAGERLSMAQLAREMGVSNIPVREAMLRLEAEGWLEHAQNAGMRVAVDSVEAWVELMTPLAVLSGFATAEARPVLMEDGGIEELREINVVMRTALDCEDYAEAAEANWRFHQRIFDSTPHAELRRSISETWQRLQMLRRRLFGVIPLRAVQSTIEHDELIEMLERGAEGLEIEVLARAHMLRTVEASNAARGASRAASGAAAATAP